MSASDADGTGTRLERLLVELNAELIGFARAHAGTLVLSHEAPEDLVQGISSQVLESAGGLEWRGRGEARAWIYRLARRHLSDRRAHWSALKRDGGRVLRLEATRSGAGAPRAVDLSVTQTGPSTFAFRREQLVVATRALALLFPRDRQLVRWTVEGVEPAEQAERLGLSRKAADKARERAFERFRKTFRLVARSGP